MSSSSSVNHELLLEAWSKLETADVTRLAKHLYDLTAGDARLLLKSHKLSDSVYGKASEIFFAENQALHRYLIFVLWSQNRHNIKNEFVKLGCKSGKHKRLRGNIRLSLDNPRFCWCKGQSKRNEEAMCVRCDYCDEWQHCLCSGITFEEANSIEKFKCLKCRGSNLPSLFVTPKANEARIRHRNGNVTSHPADYRSDKRIGCRDKDDSASNDDECDGAQSRGPGGNEKTDFINAERVQGSQRLQERNTSDTASNDEESEQEILKRSQNRSDATDSTSNDEESEQDILNRSQNRSDATDSTSNDEESDEDSLCLSQNGGDRSDAALNQGGRDQQRRNHGLSGSDEGDVSTSKSTPRRKGENPDSPGFSRSKSERLGCSQVVSSGDSDDSSGLQSPPGKLIDVSSVPTDFTLKWTPEEFGSVVTTEDREIRGKVHKVYAVQQQSYTLYLKRKFMSINKVCLPVFKKKQLVQPQDLFAGSFLRIYAECKGKPLGCTAKYSFTVRDPPSTSNPILMQVKKTSGAIKHIKGRNLKLSLRGIERVESKKAMKGKFASAYRRDLFANADMEQLEFGNFDYVKSLKVLQQAKLEDSQAEDLHPNVLVDLFLTYFKLKVDVKGPALDGFVQRISIIPFFVIMFTQKQMDYLWEVSKKIDVTLFFDGTGTLCQKLPKPFEQKTINYYAMVLKPRDGVEAVPVLEFYTGSQDVETLESCLRTFFYTLENLITSFHSNSIIYFK